MLHVPMTDASVISVRALIMGAQGGSDGGGGGGNLRCVRGRGGSTARIFGRLVYSRLALSCCVSNDEGAKVVVMPRNS